jgi:hypothetical protein
MDQAGQLMLHALKSASSFGKKGTHGTTFKSQLQMQPRGLSNLNLKVVRDKWHIFNFFESALTNTVGSQGGGAGQILFPRTSMYNLAVFEVKKESSG